MSKDVRRVNEAISSILGLVEKFWDRLRTVKPETESLKIKCPERTAEYTFAFNPNILRKKVKPVFSLDIPTITGLEVLSLSSLKRQRQAIRKTPDGFDLLFNQLPKSDKGFLAIAEFVVQDPEAIWLLVDRTSKADRVGFGDVDEYWLHSQLKYPEALKWSYADVEIKELDVSVDVGIYSALRVALPDSLPRTMEALRNLITEKNPREVWRRALEYGRVARGHEAEYIEKLQELRTLVSTDEFQKFVVIKKDFRYSQTLPSSLTVDSEELLGLPKFAKVLARTSLSIDKPAAEGNLVYKSKEFQNTAMELFGRTPKGVTRRRRKKKSKKK